jgi:2-keto-4-pentenoate hydratase
MSAQAHRFAHRLLAARANADRIAPLSQEAPLSMPDAYEIARNILDIRIAQGETMVGRKIGFTNRTIWSKYGVAEPIDRPIWAPVFDSTVRYAVDNHAIQSLKGAVQPRIEPEIVFKLGATPARGASLEAIAECIEWMAHGFEIVVSPFPNWKFNAVDAIAAFGLHGLLIVGEPKLLSSTTRRNLASVLANASVSLSSGEADSFTLRAAGFGAPLAAGEIVSTGTLTDAYPVERGQTWTTAFSGVALPGLTVSFV